ncbi:MAG: Glu/Leu/Phe/Val dehydrogenase dimerization domain-containing protein [Mycobacterium sp.]
MSLNHQTAQRSPALLELTWTDPVTGCHGYVVLDSLVRGLACGGLRMRRGCTLQELRDLGHAMTLKEAIHTGDGDQRYIPVGGAKGGIDFDPESPDAPAVLDRFIKTMTPLVTTTWITGDDLGINLAWIDGALQRAGLSSPFDAALPYVGQDAASVSERVNSASTVDVDGLELADVVGGYGVAVSILRTLAYQGRDPGTVTAAIQGFGNMGGATARYLTKAGVRVIGVSDVDGLLVDKNGLDVEALLASRSQTGRMSRTDLPDTTEQRHRDDWLELPVDVLVPAATPYVINADTVSRVRATIIAEAANAPTTQDAENTLVARDVIVLPDFLANSATNAWWWWITYQDIPSSAVASFERIDRSIGTLTEQALADAKNAGISVRAAATAIAVDKLSELRAQNPEWWLK